jgi:hypothetical protein
MFTRSAPRFNRARLLFSDFDYSVIRVRLRYALRAD